ncbi:MAG TPA: hypothetical protein VMM13_08705, partial [Euzebya sp.]|nr:hypothetical protein [Euzebya sp.]
VVMASSVIAMVAVGNVQLPVDDALAATRSGQGAPVQAAGSGGGEVIEIRPIARDGMPQGAAGGKDGATAGRPGDPVTADFERIMVFGDSVAVAAIDALEALGPDVEVDARIGRQWQELVEDDRAPGPEDAVVIHLGSNGATTTETMDAVLSHFADAGRVVLVNVRVPRPWETTVNRALSGATGRWPNTRLADWHAASDGSPEWFAGDGVHVSPAGARALAGVISAGLAAD